MIPLVNLLIGLIIICLVFWAVRAILTAFSVGEPIATIVYVVLVIIIILWLAGLVGVGPSVKIG